MRRRAGLCSQCSRMNWNHSSSMRPQTRRLRLARLDVRVGRFKGQRPTVWELL